MNHGLWDKILISHNLSYLWLINRVSAPTGRRGGAVSIATTNGKSANSGVAREMFRRITGIVGSKAEPEEELTKPDSFKAKSLNALNKIPNVFNQKKDEIPDIRSVPSHTQRRPATLGLPQLKSDLSDTITKQREPRNLIRQ